MTLELALQKVIHDWLEAGKSRNLKLLSRKSGLSYPTIRRMERAEGQALLSSTVRVLEVVLGTAVKVKGFLAEWAPSHWKHLDYDADSDTVYLPVTNANSLHVAVVRATTYSPQTESSLLAMLGASSDPALKDLIKAEVLEIKDSSVVMANKSTFIPSQEFAKESAKQIAENTDLSLPGNIIDTAFELTSNEHALEYYEAFLDFKARLAAIKTKVIKSPKEECSKKIAFSINLTMY